MFGHKQHVSTRPIWDMWNDDSTYIKGAYPPLILGKNTTELQPENEDRLSPINRTCDTNSIKPNRRVYKSQTNSRKIFIPISRIIITLVVGSRVYIPSYNEILQVCTPTCPSGELAIRQRGVL